MAGHTVWEWLDRHLGNRVNVDVGVAASDWALEAYGELHRWAGAGERAVAGLYLVGDAALLDLSRPSSIAEVRERRSRPGVEQLVVELGDGSALTVTVEVGTGGSDPPSDSRGRHSGRPLGHMPTPPGRLRADNPPCSTLEGLSARLD